MYSFSLFKLNDMRIFKQFYCVILLAPSILFSCSEADKDLDEVTPEEEPVIVDNVGVGLVTHFKLNGNAEDATAESFDASTVGEPTIVDGIEGSAIYFNEEDGDNGCGQPGGDYIKLPVFGPIWEEGFSVTAWVQFTEIRNYERIINLGNGRGEDGGMPITFGRLMETNDLALTSWNNEEAYSNRNDGRLIAEDAIENGKLQFLVGTIDKNGRMVIYKDGILIAEKDDGQPIVNVERSSNFLAHSNYCKEDPDFKGILDEVKIYNYALSAEEVAEMAAAYNLPLP